MTRTLWSGEMELGEYTGDGALLRRYVPLSGVDERLGRIEANGQGFYHLTDRLGSVVGVIEAGSGQLAQAFGYSPYGESNASAAGEPFRFTGRYLDAETGLYHYRARYYHATTGRFLQTDPIGYEDQLNLYAYVGNDPVNNTDPTGKQVAAAAAPLLCAGPQALACGAVLVVGTALVACIAYCDDAARAIGNILKNESAEGGPALPEGIVGEQDDRARQQGGRQNSGPLTGEHGGTGDADADFDVLTGGKSGPAPEDRRLPEGSRQGENGVIIRPGTDTTGPRIDIPKSGEKPHETLHYPRPPLPPEERR